MKSKELLKRLVTTFERMEDMTSAMLEEQVKMRQNQEAMDAFWMNDNRVERALRDKDFARAEKLHKIEEQFSSEVMERQRAEWAREDKVWPTPKGAGEGTAEGTGIEPRVSKVEKGEDAQ